MKTVMATSLESRDVRRIRRLAERESTTEAAIMRKLILRELPQVELEVLGLTQERKGEVTA